MKLKQRTHFNKKRTFRSKDQTTAIKYKPRAVRHSMEVRSSVLNKSFITPHFLLR